MQPTHILLPLLTWLFTLAMSAFSIVPLVMHRRCSGEGDGTTIPLNFPRLFLVLWYARVIGGLLILIPFTCIWTVDGRIQICVSHLGIFFGILGERLFMASLWGYPDWVKIRLAALAVTSSAYMAMFITTWVITSLGKDSKLAFEILPLCVLTLHRLWIIGDCVRAACATQGKSWRLRLWAWSVFQGILLLAHWLSLIQLPQTLLAQVNVYISEIPEVAIYGRLAFKIRHWKPRQAAMDLGSQERLPSAFES